MKEILNRLVRHEELTREETKEVLINITQNVYSQEQITAFIMGLQMRGISVDELLGLRDGILETGIPVDTKPYKVIDIVGTGGDGKNTFNISTCACFVVAGAGYKVVKHGNYAATSISGASNVIEGHGVKFTSDNNQIKRSLDKCNIAYLHAQLFAKAMKFVGPIRKSLQIPTCFNLLGPLVNPALPDYQVLGVANLDQMRLYQNVYQRMGINYAIVNSLDGYDEISLTGDFKITTNSIEKIFKPEDFGFSRTKSDDLRGGVFSTKEDAVRVFDSVLANESTESQKNVVLANAAVAIHIIEKEKSLEDCLAIARESLESGKAMEILKKFIDLNS